MAEASLGNGESSDLGAAPESTPVKSCGIVMPIAAMLDEYSEEHWRRVRKILERSIEKSGLRSQLFWENPEVDVIQSAILRNIYENDVVICDVSGLNPNVMLETGLRLSTKRPTIIVTDKIKRPPFDIGTIRYIEYQRDLEYNAIEAFIEQLSKRIVEVSAAYIAGTYKSFVENFEFQTVTPKSIDVSAEEYIKDKLESLTMVVRRIERQQRRQNHDGMVEPAALGRSQFSEIATYNLTIPDERREQLEYELDKITGAISHFRKLKDGTYAVSLRRQPSSPLTVQDAIRAAEDIILKLT